MSDSNAFLLTTNAQAFGDGAHPSTQGAMAALDALSHLHGVGRVLDMGCGSGILSLKAAYQWHAPVLAVDIEAESVATTAENAKNNKLDALITTIQSDGFANPLIGQRAPYDVVLANMLAEPLVVLAHGIASVLSDEGVVVLSGILRWHGDRIEQAYSGLNLTLLQRYSSTDWLTYIWQRQTD